MGWWGEVRVEPPARLGKFWEMSLSVSSGELELRIFQQDWKPRDCGRAEGWGRVVEAAGPTASSSVGSQCGGGWWGRGR